MTSLVFLVHTGDPVRTLAISSRHKDKNIIRSTAAKEAHALRRRIRTAQYQADKDKAAARFPTIPQCHDSWTVLATTRVDPFASFAMQLTARDKFLFDHYVTILIPHWVAQPFPRQQQQLRGTTDSTARRALYNDMACLAVTDAGLLTTTMLAACRHLSRHARVQPPGVRAAPLEYYLTTAMEYKSRCVKSVIDDIARRSRVQSLSPQVSCQDIVLADRQHKVKQVEVDNVTLTKIMVLVLDEIWLGDIVMARHHLLGAMKIVDLNGGPQALPKCGFVASMFETFLNNTLLNIQAIRDEWPSSFQEADSSMTIFNSKDICVNPCDTMALQFFHDRNQRIMYETHQFAESG